MTASGTYYFRFYVMNMSSPVVYFSIDVTISVSDANHPSVDSIVKSAVAQCNRETTGSDYDRALWLHDWLNAKMEYDKTPAWCSAEGALTRGLGTCESYQRAYAKRLEAIRINIQNDSNLGIQYTTHCQTYGWIPWSYNGETNGTSGESKQLEAIKIQLTGADAGKYDVYYRVHAQHFGWLGWAKNGESSGTAGYAYRLEGIRILLVPKGAVAPASNYGGMIQNNPNTFIAR